MLIPSERDTSPLPGTAAVQAAADFLVHSTGGQSPDIFSASKADLNPRDAFDSTFAEDAKGIREYITTPAIIVLVVIVVVIIACIALCCFCCRRHNRKKERRRAAEMEAEAARPPPMPYADSTTTASARSSVSINSISDLDRIRPQTERPPIVGQEEYYEGGEKPPPAYGEPPAYGQTDTTIHWDGVRSPSPAHVR